MSDGTLIALLAGAALAFYIIYNAVQEAAEAAAGGGRKKRSAANAKTQEDRDFDIEHLLFNGRF